MIFIHYQTGRHGVFFLNMCRRNATQCLWLRTKMCHTHVRCAVLYSGANSLLIIPLQWYETYLFGIDQLIYIRPQKDIAVLPSNEFLKSWVGQSESFFFFFFFFVFCFVFFVKSTRSTKFGCFFHHFSHKTPNMNKIGCFPNHPTII